MIHYLLLIVMGTIVFANDPFICFKTRLPAFLILSSGMGRSFICLLQYLESGADGFELANCFIRKGVKKKLLYDHSFFESIPVTRLMIGREITVFLIVN